MEIENVCLVGYDINKKIKGGARTMTLDFEVNDGGYHSVTIDTDYMGLDYTACEYGDGLHQDLESAIRKVMANKDFSELGKKETIEAIKDKIEENWYGSGVYRKFEPPTKKEDTIRPKRLSRSLEYA